MNATATAEMNLTAGRPDVRADALARELAETAQDSAGTDVLAVALLVGSRSRGNHRPDSDADLILHLEGREKDVEPILERVAGNLGAWRERAEALWGLTVDVVIAEQWGTPRDDDRRGEPVDGRVHLAPGREREIGKLGRILSPAESDGHTGLPVRLTTPRLECAWAVDDDGRLNGVVRYDDLWAEG